MCQSEDFRTSVHTESIVECVLSFLLVARYGHLDCTFKHELSNTVLLAGKIVGRLQKKPLSQLPADRTRNKARSIQAVNLYSASVNL